MSFTANYLLIGQVCNNSVPLLIFQSMIPICRISASSLLLLLIQILGLCPPAPGLTLSSANLHEFVINTQTGFQVRIINYHIHSSKKSEKSLSLDNKLPGVLPSRLLARSVSHADVCQSVLSMRSKLGHSPRVRRANILQTGFPVDNFIFWS